MFPLTPHALLLVPSPCLWPLPLLPLNNTYGFAGCGARAMLRVPTNKHPIRLNRCVALLHQRMYLMTSNDHNPDHQQYRPGSPETQGGLGGVMDRTEDRVKEAGHDAMKAMDGKRSSAADSLDGAAQQLHTGADKAADIGQKGGEKISKFAHGAADKLQASADYVREHDFKQMMKSVEDYVRQNPGQALVAAGVVGFLTARAIRSD